MPAPDTIPDRGTRLPAAVPPRLRSLAGSVARPEARPPLDRFSIRSRVADLRSGWRAVEGPRILAPFHYALWRLRYARITRIALLALLLTPLVVVGTLVVAGIDSVQQLVVATREQHREMQHRADTVILVLGTDDVPGGTGLGLAGRSDTMLVVNVQYNQQRIRVLSIPRDTFVMVEYEAGKPARGDKIAHAFRRGGLARSLAAVKRLTRLPIHHYVAIDYGLFRSFIDRIGGVPVEIESRMFYEDKAGGLKIDFQPGFSLLDGQRALEYVRFRKDGHGDLGRIVRQQKFMRAVVEKLLDPRVLSGLLTEDTIKEFLRHLDTDMVPAQLLPLLVQFRSAQPSAFEAEVLPGSHQLRKTPWSGSRPLSYFFPDLAATDRKIDEWLLSAPRGEPTSEVLATVTEDRRVMHEILSAPELPPGVQAAASAEETAVEP